MSDHPDSRLRGFRLLDLCVVLGVVVIVIGMLASAVGRTREAAARCQCEGNLCMIAVGIHSYADAHDNKLPPLSGAPITGNTAYPSSVFGELLPFIGEDNIHQAMMSSPNGCTWQGRLPGGLVSGNARVRTFVCPSDSSNSDRESRANGWMGSSYAANALVFGNVAEVVTDEQATPQSWNVLRSEYTVGSIPDGTSNTIFIAERFALAGRRAAATPCAWADPPAGGVALGNPDVDAMGCPLYSFVSNNGPLRASICGPGIFFATGTKDDPLGARGGEPLYPLPEIGVSPWRASTDGRAQSGHTAVVQVAMGDGSRRSITSAVSQLTWVRAIDPTDHNPLGSDW
jgi:hypothetical protein